VYQGGPFRTVEAKKRARQTPGETRIGKEWGQGWAEVGGNNKAQAGGCFSRKKWGRGCITETCTGTPRSFTRPGWGKSRASRGFPVMYPGGEFEGAVNRVRDRGACGKKLFLFRGRKTNKGGGGLNSGKRAEPRHRTGPLFREGFFHCRKKRPVVENRVWGSKIPGHPGA